MIVLHELQVVDVHISSMSCCVCTLGHVCAASTVYCSAECFAFPISYTEVKLSSLHFLITRRLSSLHVLIAPKWNVFLQIAPILSSSHFLIDVIHISIPCKTGKTEQYIRDAKCMVAIEASFPLSKCLQLFDKQWSAANKLQPNLELAIHVMLDRISWNCIRET